MGTFLVQGSGDGAINCGACQNYKWCLLFQKMRCRESALDTFQRRLAARVVLPLK